jgi:hypothetical protein
MSDEDLEALREQTAQGDRLDEAASAAATQAFVEDIVAELEAIDDGEQQKTVSLWDGPTAAFVRALENNPEQLATVEENLQQRLDVDEGEMNRSDLLSLALRLGFQTAAPEQFDAVRDAVEQHATQGL